MPIANAGRGKGKRSVQKVTARDRDMMSRLYRETGNYAEVARRTGFAYPTVYKHLNGQDVIPTGDVDWRKARMDGEIISDADVPPPKRWAQLSEQERGWLTDFASFRKEFFDRETPPFHVQIADMVSSRVHDKIQVLCPPGHGKSQCFSVDFPIWEMIRQRAMEPHDGWACMLISKSEKMAQAFLSQIKQQLEQNMKLQRAFGRFKPEYPDVWRRDMLTVEGFAIRKEPTFITAGAGSHIYGWRVKLIIGDDIVDGENSGTPEKTDKLAQWHADELVSRLDDPGVIVNVGTRFAIYDLHGRILRQVDDDGTPLWYPVIYKAHDESRCTGEHCLECKNKCHHDKPWPDGCTLWPGWVSYRKLRRLRAGSTTGVRFEFIYNQTEIPEEGALVRPEWIEACKDTSRGLWDIPQGSRVICTLDPSPTKWAVAQAWAWNPNDQKQYFLAQHRQRNMQSPAYLALMRDWTLRLRRLGYDPIWIIEINAAQRWLLQSTEYMQMRYELGLTVNPHTTGRNKADAEYGVGAIGPAYEYGMVVLPAGTAEARQATQPLIDELITYPGETDDCVMAEWFFVWNLRKIQQPMSGQFLEYPEMPPWLLEGREMVDMQSGKHTKVHV